MNRFLSGIAPPRRIMPSRRYLKFGRCGITVEDWPVRGIVPGLDGTHPRDNVERAARSFCDACCIEDFSGVSRMLSARLLAQSKGTNLTAFGVLGEEKDFPLMRELRGNWEGKADALRKVVQAWNRYAVAQIRALAGESISFGVRYFIDVLFEGAPKDVVSLSFIPDRTYDTNGFLVIDTLPPWFSLSTETNHAK